MAIKHGSTSINHVKRRTEDTFVPLSVYQVNHYNTIVFVETPSGGAWQTQEISGTAGSVYVSTKGGYVATGTVNAGQVEPWQWQNEYYPYITSLPSEYQEVEYIESPGGANYFDAAITFEEDYTEMNIKYYNRTLQFGTSNIGGSTRYTLAMYGNGNLYIGKGGTGGMITYPDGGPHTLHVTSTNGTTTYIIDGVENTKSYPGVANGSPGSGLFMFARLDGTSMRYSSAGCRIYYCQLYKSDGIVRNFVPCYRKSDNAVGLYDLVSNTFFENQGTGTFIKGNNIVSRTITDIRYVKTGTGTFDYHYEIDWEIVTGTQAGEVTGTLNYFNGWIL